MPEKSRRNQDAFTFSLNGMRATSSFGIALAIANDRINDAQRREHQPAGPVENPGIKGRFWLHRRRAA